MKATSFGAIEKNKHRHLLCMRTPKANNVKKQNAGSNYQWKKVHMTQISTLNKTTKFFQLLSQHYGWISLQSNLSGGLMELHIILHFSELLV